jgi:enoyl-CoA hydratase/carnithine racemase
MGTNGRTADDAVEGDERFELGDVVEPALARALVLAAEAGRWGLVERIAAELGVRARQRAGEPAKQEPVRRQGSRRRQ